MVHVYTSQIRNGQYSLLLPAKDKPFSAFLTDLQTFHTKTTHQKPSCIQAIKIYSP